MRSRMTDLYYLVMKHDTDLSLCCEAFTTYMEVGTDENGETIWGLCCKACCAEIE